MTEQENRQYFNDPQMYSLLMNTRDEAIVAGRGEIPLGGLRVAIG